MLRRRGRILAKSSVDDRSPITPSNTSISWCPINDSEEDERLLNLITHIHDILRVEDLYVEPTEMSAFAGVPEWCFDVETQDVDTSKPFQWLYSLFAQLYGN